MKLPKLLAGLATGLLLVTACNLGEPTSGTGGGTGVEGIAGQVTAPGGISVAGASVKVFPVLYPGLGKAGTHAFPAADSATVNATGTFAFPNLTAGTYNLVATLERGDSTLTLFLTGIVVTDSGTDLGVDTLKLAGSVVLQVASGGTPVAGAHCFLPFTPFDAVSDSDGRCTLDDLPPGNFEITVTHPNFQVGVSGDVTVLPGLLSTGGLLDLVGTVAGPPPPVLIFPAAEALLSEATTDFVWMMATGATRYHLQVTLESDTNFTSPLLNNPDLTEPAAPLTLRTTGQTYRWRVRSGNGSVFGAWSPTRTYSAIVAPLPASHFSVTAATQALWTFNEVDSAGRFIDLSGKGHHLTAPSTVQLAASPHGQAVSFNGARLTLTNATAVSLAGQDTLTYEARIWLDAYPSASLWNGGTTLIGQYAGLKLLINKNGRIQAASQSGDGTTWFWFPPVSDTGKVPLGRWVNVAVAAVRNGSQLYAYVDNVPVGVYLDIAGGATLRPSSITDFPFTIGNDGQDNQPFPGRVDEIRVSRGLPLGPGLHILGSVPGCSPAPVVCDL